MSATDKLIKRIGELEVELYKLQLEHESGYALRRKIETLEEQFKATEARLKAEIAIKDEIIEDQRKVIKGEI